MDATSGTKGLNRVGNALFICAMVFACLILILPMASANAEKRALKFYFLHTGERAEIVFKRNGRYLQSGLTRINKLLRDWRRNEQTKMDPKLLDLIWEVYKETGSKKYIHVISAYRSPETNSLLRKRGRGVAKKSQHTLGKALDFFVPGVSLKKLRDIGLKKGTGGVGYYPKSGSPFVHMDTGSVRHWPRMSRSELAKVFPKGKTLHVPTDGKPLARYNQARAEYERRTRGSGRIEIATAEEIEKEPNRFKRRFGRVEDDGENFQGIIAAVPKPVRTSAEPAPIPADSVTASPAPVQNTNPAPGSSQSQPGLALASLQGSQIPVPRASPLRVPQLVAAPSPQTVSPETGSESNAVRIASIVPVRRPSSTGEIGNPGSGNDTDIKGLSGQPTRLAKNSPAIAQEAPIEIALIEQDPSPRPQPVEAPPAAKDIFTINEIQDLRKQVYASIGNENQNLVPPAAIPLALNNPRTPETPGNQIPIEAFDQNRLSLFPETRRREEIAGQVIASILSDPSGPGISSTRTPEARTRSQWVGNAASAFQDNHDAVEPAPTLALGNPKRSADPDSTIEEKPVFAVLVPKAATNTLERFETINLEERVVGKWALAANTSISHIAEINPPAYGLNALRETPGMVLSSGFSRDNVARIENGFTGSSLEFLDFTRFN